MNILSSYNKSLGNIGYCLMLLFVLTFATPSAKAQTPSLKLGGKVYGGGKKGSVGIGNVSTDVTLYTYYTQTEANTYNAKLDGAIAAGTALTAEQVTKVNTALKTTTYEVGNSISEADANSYNATLEGAVKEGDKKTVVDPTDVKMANASAEATEVTIKSGEICAVFGGGEQGRSYGVTKVNIEGGTLGVTDNTDSANGNAFAAGDGASAYVFGGSVLTVSGGTITQNAYGGGNEANLIGTTTVDLKGGTFVHDVYGGAKIANVYGRTYVNINGAKAVGDLNIANVYGGNDISGNVSPATATDNPNWTWAHQSALNTLPFTLATTPNLSIKPNTVVDGTWNAFIRATASADHTVKIDNLYGGGNGDYGEADAEQKYKDGDYAGKNKPEIAKTYLQIEGGVYGNLYGGGNAATVTESTDICLMNADTHNYKSDDGYTYQFDRVFGGNNQAEMSIRPNWYLQQARINNLYSGGNAGKMTYFKPAVNPNPSYGGIYLAIESTQMTVNNVYGGCRMADVDPGKHQGSTENNVAISAESINGFTYANGYAARVLIKGGNINNVYGGNDISGNVYYGSQVEILSSINGDVYGAGNGSYTYTDKKTDSEYYYKPGTNSAEALNHHRPNVENVMVHVAGTSAEHPTYVGGALYCGGNSATLRKIGGNLADAHALLQIGSHVVIDKVFLGSNGANMVTEDILKEYAKDDVSSLNLKNSDTFEEYMRGVEVAITPTVAFDNDYVGYSAKFGSMYCGGNVGSMSASGLFTINFLNSLVIYDKLVGGSNNANVAKSQYNAFHLGGIIGAPDANSKKIQLNISGLKLEPRLLTGSVNDGFSLANWNYTDKNHTMLQHANIYGGCYNSGYINGGVDINITEKAYNDFTASGVTFDAIRDDVLASTLSVYGGGYGEETEIWGNTNINITNSGQILKAYGGGEMGVVGKLSRDADGVVQKNTTINIDSNTTPTPKTVASFAATYNSNVTLNAPIAADVMNAAKVYGGGFQGLVSGNATVNLNQGRVYDAFGGASNADILGTANMFVGKTSAPEVTHNVYGANDFGGQIAGTQVKKVTNVTKNAETNGKMQSILCQSYVEYSSGKILGSLFGGPCGSYDYTAAKYTNAIAATGFTKPHMLVNLYDDTTGKATDGTSEYGCNSFVNVISQSVLAKDAVTGAIYGAGEGLKGKSGMADEAGSYVRLASASVAQRRAVGALSPNVYGAGYCSTTGRSLVDAFEGYYGKVFGGCYGITLAERTSLSTATDLSYMGNRSAVHLHDMVNATMDIYGAGANSGTKESKAVLYGGQAQNVYGASFDEGVTYAAHVNVPASSTSKVNNIFGGAKGKSDVYPCDAFNTYITYSGTNARVKGALYGGNHNARVTRNACVTLNTTLKNFDEQLGVIFGGGLGEETVTLYTEVNLEDGSQLANVYGGGEAGKVLDTPSFRQYLETGKIYTNTTGTYGYEHYLGEHDVIAFHNWIDALHDAQGSSKKDQNGAYIATYQPDQYGHTHDIYHLSTQQAGLKNTNVFIKQGAVVENNAYGGGLGETAQVSGKTSIYLHGGVVKGDMYGGGNAGPVIEYASLIMPEGITEITESSTNVYLGGGCVRNVYGGGLGQTADVTGTTNVVMGQRDTGENKYQVTQLTHDEQYTTPYAGDACVGRSLYGGGQNGAVFGAAKVTINQGHIGYKYENGNYVENLKLTPDDEQNTLKENGNAFGGGYGEGASVDITFVNIYGGTIRNGLYGGGEIAAIGRGSMKVENGADRVLDAISLPGRTHIYMYDGLVQGDVFGGGRGFSYDETGNEVIGKTIYTDGYVFGTTDVNIRGGEIGTTETLKEGHGNVFGGGNIGYVYSDATKATDTENSKIVGRYYTNTFTCDKCGATVASSTTPVVCTDCHRSTNATQADQKTTFTSGLTNVLSEDTRVIVSPWARTKEQITINGTTELETKTFNPNDFIPTEYLNLLEDKNTDSVRWAKISKDGVVIRNAVFAGGNVSAGSDKVYANAVTVFGNATATVNDVFFRDFITLGTDHVGGLYGDGNLTFVDGYRELNLTNYGTDYYGQDDYITLQKYKELNDRERAYFKLEYQANVEHEYSYHACIVPGTYGGVTYVLDQHIYTSVYDKLTDDEKAKFTTAPVNASYTKTSRVTEDVYKMMPTDEQEKWTPYGFCSIYAGRIMNTIQRADFCGVFGSRVVLQGAQDRVPEVIDYTNYTINRVGEVSLNKRDYALKQAKLDAITGTDDESNKKRDDLRTKLTHGNYFGLYNIVNYLGALTSDVKFDDVRTYDNSNGTDYAPTSTDQTYYQWKVANKNNKKRNNGTSHNMVALASGVYLEIVQEQGSTKENKNYGYVTGVVQLDLINVMTGLGGGYVYAKNVHGLRSGSTGTHSNLSSYNQNAVNRSGYDYTESNLQTVETSGNFIHNTKQIIDDCFPGGGRYDDYNVSPAHYWFIRGETYVYDQYISAYTGSSNAYLENTDIPLTITANAHGEISLLDIKPNYYAYYKSDGTTKLTGEEKILVNNLTYQLNDVITYWDYMQLSTEQKRHFVTETYVPKCDYQAYDSTNKTGTGVVVKAGTAILPSEYESTWKNVAASDSVWDATNKIAIAKSELYHPSNNVSHEKGYIVTVDITNPGAWDKWYCSSSDKISTEDYNKSTTNKDNYLVGPTYHPDVTNVYGQRYYQRDDIVTGTVKEAYESIPTDYTDKLENQATVVPAYVAVTAAEYDMTDSEGNTVHKNVQAGVGISATEWGKLDAATKAKFEAAYTCTSTYVVNKDANEYVYYSTLISTSEYNRLKALLIADYNPADSSLSYSDAETKAKKTLNGHFDNAYIVTDAKGGNYGGRLFEKEKVYSGLDAWASLSAADRTHFVYDYDALDVLIDKDYPGDGEKLSLMKTYDGGWATATDSQPAKPVYSVVQPIDYMAKYEGNENLDATTSIEKTVTKGDVLTRTEFEGLPNEQHYYASFKTTVPGIVYVVKESFTNGGVSYSAGKIIDESIYNSFDDTRKGMIVQFNAPEAATYYICRTSYEIGKKGKGANVSIYSNTTETADYTSGQTVPTGTIITAATYGTLPNDQKNFSIFGSSPIETSTLYVSNESDIYDLSRDRVITVVYQYKYEESDESGNNIDEITEKHIVNIHIQFKSGVPTVGQLQEPSIVLPGQTVGLSQPTVTEGAYTILGGGWELYSNATDATKHQNGTDYINNATQMYWYQDGYYVAYYAKTYLGKTFSNAVPFHVANYHDIADVMADTKNYMYVDNPGVSRNSKIYIDNSYNEKNAEATKTELDMLYDLFQTSLASSKKTIKVDVQDKDESGNLLYYEKDEAGNRLNTKTTTETPYPVTHQEDQQVSIFDDHARNCENLEFYITNDLTTKKNDWQSIGSSTDDGLCFRGSVHGNGHTISGLNNSLFENLCGYVYNLGVTGSYTKSGIADKVSNYGSVTTQPDGFAQNCWINTTGTPDANYLPVVNAANDLGNVNKMHVFNCYVPQENGYTVPTDNAYKYATVRPMQSFNNGEVAFNLNGFYLNKRYADNYPVTKEQAEANAEEGHGGSIYKYWNQNADGTLHTTPDEAYYKDGALYVYNKKNYGYVESMYADGDFVYANGEIPTVKNQRYSSAEGRYLPIWPDDYLFFGQTLTYGYDEANRPYQSMPSTMMKSDDADHRLNTTEATNIVFRAPAYYRNSKMDVVHFNPGAVFADHVKDNTDQPIHRGLTALDFTGCNDVVKLNSDGTGFENIPTTQAYSNGLNSKSVYFAPVLNFTTLLGFETHDITQNLLTYVPSDSDGHAGHKKTNEVLTDYFNEPAYDVYYDNTNNYRKVTALTESELSSIHGHIVQKNGGYVAHTDHFLVDRQDFNAPIAYSFEGNATSGKRMWYQRQPDNYVDATKGWEGVSIPFQAELVTTQNKGEITHFYKKASADGYTQGYDTGHEYWLRRYTGIDSEKTTEQTAVANFLYPDAEANNKTVNNTFLWDYYYSVSEGKDANQDDYNADGNDDDTPRNFYAAKREYTDYPLSKAGMPYIVGFPGSRYYEFDLSGEFQAQNTASAIAQLGKQTITFASASGADIKVSDDELSEQTQSIGGYSFKPNYLNYEIPVEAYNKAYLLNKKTEDAAGNVTRPSGESFDVVTDAGHMVEPFRPFFMLASINIAIDNSEPTVEVDNDYRQVKPKRYIQIGATGISDEQFEYDGDGNGFRNLKVYGTKGAIVVESTLDYERTVTISGVNGIVFSTFSIAPGQKVVTKVPAAGVYIVNRKKVSVKL